MCGDILMDRNKEIETKLKLTAGPIKVFEDIAEFADGEYVCYGNWVGEIYVRIKDGEMCDDGIRAIMRPNGIVGDFVKICRLRDDYVVVTKRKRKNKNKKINLINLEDLNNGE